jgi:hypothetical protein
MGATICFPFFKHKTNNLLFALYFGVYIRPRRAPQHLVAVEHLMLLALILSRYCLFMPSGV